MSCVWDYLILTAANAGQAAAYERQLEVRRVAGRLPQARETLVVPDAGGRRIGSGGSTIECLLAVVRREGSLAGRRILILHAGGDSRRLPAYSACGKIFVPLPGGDGPLPYGRGSVSELRASGCLFDRLVSVFSSLPPAPGGQVLVASGDVLTLFEAAALDLSRPGITALGAEATPEEAARHGVFCEAPGGAVRLYLQKPTVEEQRACGAIGPDGRSVLDVGIMSFSPEACLALLRAVCAPAWKPAFEAAVRDYGLDLYREICCALGAEATLDGYLRGTRESGSRWPEPLLEQLFAALRGIPLYLQKLPPGCRFLHFGSTRQLISSGLELIAADTGAAPDSSVIPLATEMLPGGAIHGQESWVEGCRLSAPLTLGGWNAVTGVDAGEPLRLPAGACVDVSKGPGRAGRPVWFVRCYGIDDSFKYAQFCGLPLAAWMAEAGVSAEDLWDAAAPAGERTLWNARVFPAEAAPSDFRKWLWMFEPARATAEQKRAFLEAERYSAAEIALRAECRSR